MCKINHEMQLLAMEFDVSWDVNKYHYHYELPHHWELKKKFMLANKTKFPEERLICLAQIFCNVHYLGCRYVQGVYMLMKILQYTHKQITYSPFLCRTKIGVATIE